MGRVPDLSAVLEGLCDKPFLGPKPDQLLMFKRPQLAIMLQALMQLQQLPDVTLLLRMHNVPGRISFHGLIASAWGWVLSGL